MADAHIGPSQAGTAQPVDALGTDDFKQLMDLATSSDESTRAQALSLAKKMTPAESTAFVDYQKRAFRDTQGLQEGSTLTHRTDNSLFGMPPEMVAAMGLPILKSIVGPSITASARWLAASKSFAAQTAPILKYEFVKTGLEKLGVPSSVSWIPAMAASGYAGRGSKVPVAADVAVAPAASEAASAAAPAPTAAPIVAAAAPTQAFNVGSAMADVSKVFKGLGTTPQAAEVNNAASMMRFGKTAEEAVARVIAQRPAPMSATEAAAKLAARFGTPTDAEMTAAVAARNARSR